MMTRWLQLYERTWPSVVVNRCQWGDWDKCAAKAWFDTNWRRSMFCVPSFCVWCISESGPIVPEQLCPPSLAMNGPLCRSATTLWGCRIYTCHPSTVLSFDHHTSNTAGHKGLHWGLFGDVMLHLNLFIRNKSAENDIPDCAGNACNILHCSFNRDVIDTGFHLCFPNCMWFIFMI